MTKPNAMTRAEAIESFRANEEIESVLVLLGKDTSAAMLRKVALAWPKVPVETKNEKRAFEASPALWEQLWEDVRYDHEKLQKVTGYSAVFAAVAALKGYRLIYPDGTLAVAAQKALRQLAKNELGL